MQKENKTSGRGGRREGSGRPMIGDKLLKTKSIRCTDDEYQKIKEFLKQLRAE